MSKHHLLGQEHQLGVIQHTPRTIKLIISEIKFQSLAIGKISTTAATVENQFAGLFNVDRIVPVNRDFAVGAIPNSALFHLCTNGK